MTTDTAPTTTCPSWCREHRVDGDHTTHVRWLLDETAPVQVEVHAVDDNPDHAYPASVTLLVRKYTIDLTRGQLLELTAAMVKAGVLLEGGTGESSRSPTA